MECNNITLQLGGSSSRGSSPPKQVDSTARCMDCPWTLQIDTTLVDRQKRYESSYKNYKLTVVQTKGSSFEAWKENESLDHKFLDNGPQGCAQVPDHLLGLKTKTVWIGYAER